MQVQVWVWLWWSKRSSWGKVLATRMRVYSLKLERAGIPRIQTMSNATVSELSLLGKYTEGRYLVRLRTHPQLQIHFELRGECLTLPYHTLPYLYLP